MRFHSNNRKTRLPPKLRQTVSGIYLGVVTSGHVTKMAVAPLDPP